MINKKSEIIIFGGAGYIGSTVTDFFLRKNFSVKCVDNLIYNQKKPSKKKNFLFYKLDISKTNQIKKLLNEKSIVILLAGLVGDPITKKYPKLSKKINENYTTKLIDQCFKKKVDHLVFVSTCSNYGITKNNKMVDENSQLNPLSLYAKSKIRIEKYLQKRSKKNNTKTTILRFATAFGVSKRMRFDLTVNQFVREIFLQNKLEVYDTGTWRPYCHVNDFAGAIFKAIKKKGKKLVNIYNVGSNKNNFTKENIIKKIQKYIKLNNVSFVEKSLDYRNYRVNFNKMKKDLNFVPKYSLDYGIREIIKLMKKNLFLDLAKSKDRFGNYFINKN
tara:strand:- start:812 stop:1804 length:993 start_codon:yes stop_codon:yes gene_type:complete